MDIENFLASAHAYTETSKRTYRDVIPRVLSNVDIATISASQLLNIIQNIEGWGNARQQVALAACKKYLAWTFGETHPALNAKIKRAAGKQGRAFDKTIALRLLASFNRYETKGARDLAMCSLMLDTGLRASEICRLEQAYTDTEKRILQVIVKGGQWELAVFSQETAMQIDWWKTYREKIKGETFLFTHSKSGKGLTPEGLYNIVESWGLTIGIKLSPHDFRRSMAGIATTETNTPERILMEGGRWKDSKMVHRYTRHLRLEAMRNHLIVPAITKPKP